MLDSPVQRLAIHGRFADQVFTAEERLFLRVEHTSEDGKHPLPAELGYPGSDGMSVNREKYSLAEDVLWPSWPKFGVAAISHAELTSMKFESGDARLFALSARHDPSTPERGGVENYAHTLVLTVLLPKGEPVTPPGKVKKEARMHLAAAMVIVRAPTL